MVMIVITIMMIMIMIITQAHTKGDDGPTGRRPPRVRRSGNAYMGGFYYNFTNIISEKPFIFFYSNYIARGVKFNTFFKFKLFFLLKL